MASAHKHHIRQRLQRLQRRFGFDGNGLRRTIDRQQRRIGLAAAALFAGTAPPLCASIVSMAYQSEAAKPGTAQRIWVGDLPEVWTP